VLFVYFFSGWFPAEFAGPVLKMPLKVNVTKQATKASCSPVLTKVVIIT